MGGLLCRDSPTGNSVCHLLANGKHDIRPESPTESKDPCLLADEGHDDHMEKNCF